MSWLSAVPVGLVSVLWLFLPGLIVTYLVGLRGVAAWALAPIVTIAEIAVLAVIAAKLGVPWSVPLVAVVCLVIAAATAAVAFMLRRRAPAREPDPRSVTAAAAIGLVPALLLGAVTMARGFGRPDALSQTFDGVFHYNAVALILDSRNASSLTMGSLGTPGLPGTFYPAAWHDLTSLVVLTSGSTIQLAVNVVCAVVSIVIWPLSCLLLVRQIVGRSAAAMAITGVLSIGFNAYPWGLLSWGVLWPNLLGMSIAPAGLAVVISLCGLAKDDALGRGRAWLLLPVTVLATTLAHPNVLFSLVALSIFPVATALVRRTLRLRTEGRTKRGIAEILVAVAIFAAGWSWAATTPVLAAVRTYYWPPFILPAHAFGEVLLGATNEFPSLWLLSVLVLLGCLLCARNVNLRWVVAGQVVSGVLYMLTASLNRPSTQMFTGYWYNDSHRLAAMLPITGVPLAVLAVLYVAKRVQPVIRRGSPLVVATGLTLVLVALTGGWYLRAHAFVVALNYSDTMKNHPNNRLVDAREQAFFGRIKNKIPADSVVAGNPWDGSALLWALEDRRTLFAHLGIATTADQDYLAKHLINVASDPRACAAANRLHVGYLLIGNGTYWPSLPQWKEYVGLADPGSKPGFQLVDSDGALKLYRLTACSTT